MELQELTEKLIAHYQDGLELWQDSHETDAGHFSASHLVHRDWDTLSPTECGSWLACFVYCLEVAAMVRLANEYPGLMMLPEQQQLEAAAVMAESEMMAAVIRALPQAFAADHPKCDEPREFLPDEARSMLDSLLALSDTVPQEHQHDGDSFICLMDTMQSGAADFAIQYVSEHPEMMKPSLGSTAILQDMLVEMTVLDQQYLLGRLLAFMPRFCNQPLMAQRLEMLAEAMGKPRMAPSGQLH
ncbi:hypothetical protein [Gallaecimonas sp. GXIMD4217]|uniref:hypothetical protein n=1 Tax=Gallaecimonas sp. GXIMD4217 TaxID=3131927 RepID=UPI00311AD0FC